MSNGFGDFLGGLGGWLDKNASGLASIGSIYGALDNASDIRDLGYGTQQHLENLGNQMNTGSQFKGYGVTSGLGNTTINPNGSVNMNLGMGQQAISDANRQKGQLLMGQAGESFNQANNIAGAALGNNGVVAQGQANMGMAGNLAGNNASNPMFNQATAGVNGAMNGVQGQQSMAYDASQNFTNQAMQGTGERQAAIFDSLMAMQNPELDRQQAQQQAREYAMGRGGVMGSAYGGTAEDAAMAKARAQSMNQAAFQSREMANAEQAQQANLANQYGQLGQGYSQLGGELGSMLGSLGQSQAELGQNAANILGQIGAQQGQLGIQKDQTAQNAAQILAQIGQGRGDLGNTRFQNQYLPYEMQMKLHELSQNDAGMAQTGQLTGQDYLGQLLLGGVNSNINAQKVSSELMGNLYDSMLDNLGGSQGEDGSSSGIGGMLGSLGGLLNLF